MFDGRSCILIQIVAFAGVRVIAADVDRTGIDPNGIAGSLLISGGGPLDDSIIDRFTELAGGEEAHLVIIPTANLRGDEADAELLLEPRRSASISATEIGLRI